MTTAAQKFLSCVHRTGERFGAAHIIAVLRGSHAQKVLARGHDRLSTFGIGQDYSAAQWRDLVRAFIQLGLLEQDVDYGSLRLTSKAWDVLRGERVCAALASPTLTALPSPERTDRDEEVFQLLRQIRRELAQEAGVPPYVVFSDRALTESSMRVSLGFEPMWYTQRCNVDFSEHWHTDPIYRHKTLVAMKAERHRAFPTVEYWDENRIDDTWTISGAYGVYLIAQLFGCELEYALTAGLK